MGSNKVLQVALGRQESDEYKQNISELSNRIRGKIGLFFTKLPQPEVIYLLFLHRYFTYHYEEALTLPVSLMGLFHTTLQHSSQYSTSLC